MGLRVGGNLKGEGITCVPMIDSQCYTAENIQHCKAIIFQLKKEKIKCLANKKRLIPYYKSMCTK